MYPSQYRQQLLLLLCSILVFILAGCTVIYLLKTDESSISSIARNSTTQKARNTTSSLVSFTTTCPKTGEGRATVIQPHSHGTNPTIIYLTNDGTMGAPGTGNVMSYDVVHKTTTEVVKIEQTFIDEGQVSADGQWVLLTLYTKGHAEIRLIQIDGKDQQTLLCTPTNIHLAHVQWSPDQTQLAFSEDNTQNNLSGIYLLKLAAGIVDPILLPQNNTGYIPRAWRDSTHLYIISAFTNTPSVSMYILTTSQQVIKQQVHLQSIFTTTSSAYCWDASSADDGSIFVTSTCSGGAGIYQGSSTITMQKGITEQPQNIPFNDSMAVTMIRISGGRSPKLLFIVNNYAPATDIDTSHNGLWVMNTDGSNLTNLTTNTSSEQSTLNQFTSYSWSNVSRDGTMYTLQVTSNDIQHTNKLFYGVLGGGTPAIFASSSGGTSLEIVGWTTT